MQVCEPWVVLTTRGPKSSFQADTIHLARQWGKIFAFERQGLFYLSVITRYAFPFTRAWIGRKYDQQIMTAPHHITYAYHYTGVALSTYAEESQLTMFSKSQGVLPFIWCVVF